MKAKTLYKGDWITVKTVEDWYEYIHQHRSNGKSVAILIFREDNPKAIVGRYEGTPCHFDGIQLCSITGMVEPDYEPIDIAVKEIYEEAGIKCKRNELISLGEIRQSKASDTVVYLFLLNAGKRDVGKAIGDGTKGEEGAYCKWIPYREAIECKDPLMGCLIKKAELRGYNVTGDPDYVLKYIFNTPK